MVVHHKKKARFSSDELSVFCKQITMLLNSGIPLHEGVFLLYSEMEDAATKEVLQKLDRGVKANLPFFKALQDSEAFPDYMIHMVQVGETTGKLEEVMRSLADYYERESTVKESVKSAVYYPAVLFGMMSVILLVLVFKILPMFQSMYTELCSDMTVGTKRMMSVGMMAGKIVSVITLLALCLLTVLLIWYHFNQGERRIKNFFTHFAVTKKLTELMATGQFLSNMALMISSGLNMGQAMDLAYSAADHRKIKEKIRDCRALMERNVAFDEAVRESHLLEGMESRLVTVATKTGAQDTVLTNLSEQYNSKISGMLSRMATTIETILVVTLAMLVGGVLISVMMPLVSMITAIA